MLAKKVDRSTSMRRISLRLPTLSVSVRARARARACCYCCCCIHSLRQLGYPPTTALRVGTSSPGVIRVLVPNMYVPSGAPPSPRDTARYFELRCLIYLIAALNHLRFSNGYFPLK